MTEAVQVMVRERLASSDVDPQHPPGTAAVIGPADRPEIAVGAAFAGGFVVAFILKKITN